MKRLINALFFVTIIANSVFAQEAAKTDADRNITLPKSDSHYKHVRYYIEDVPDADYKHASEVAHETFRDIKFSVRIHWGTYSMQSVEASWPFLNYSFAQRQEYQNLYKNFNPTEFNAEEWMEFFKRCGMQAFAFTTKHHDGFSMWHTKTRVKSRANWLNPANRIIENCDLAYSIEETPFKRDIVKELCDAAHKHGIKIDLYFSHIDWYDADFRGYHFHPLLTPRAVLYPQEFGYASSFNGTGRATGRLMTPDLTQEEKHRLVLRHREQIRELLTNYGKIDMICFDEYLGKDIWQEVKKTVKMIRELQPDVMLRNRGIGNYGDYYQPEGFFPSEVAESNMPWMAISVMAGQFAYDKREEKYKDAQWCIHHLIDCVAKGGSFMVCIGPDEKGKFHPKAIRELEKVGDWLKVNGKGIYETRNRTVWKDGGVKFTRSKDSKTVYAFVENFPEKELVIESVKAKDGSEVRLLGYDKPLEWKAGGKGIIVTIPDELQLPEKRPCGYAWTFKLEQGN
ncbi:MAG: alpha-L-fucosidase [Planctomycetaceae bacterium]|jgi:alpha-L-fucosidase|nr:alpha-L-fucosidase [Planctomycetaceae bacterium]